MSAIDSGGSDEADALAPVLFRTLDSETRLDEDGLSPTLHMRWYRVVR